jgi:hypothetical protein
MMRHKRPDEKNALSILEAANREMKFILSLKPSEDSASTIIKNIYENFRMLGDALLVSQGIKSEDHILPLKELEKVKVETLRPINLVDSLRILRHNINYYGYKPSLMELEDALSIAKTCFDPLLKEVMKKVKANPHDRIK